jgi:hypothetical protein
MSIAERVAAGSSPPLDAAMPGEPAIAGRWQPARAGVVNSWAWAEETLLFADGWLALTGPNGSGKSLTASMLITVLLDGNVSQTALSVSGKAAGTLTSRHTDRSEREDRTGIWWLEYGRRDLDSGRTRYLTTGLWLRSSGGELLRAFFIAPGRVGTDLFFARDREPVRIEDLAQQLTANQGELFTSSTKLVSKTVPHLVAVSEEADYRRSVRVRLFSPLEEVQFEALVGVLRSLRSVRTAEAISPNQMRAVLTDALPALDEDRLTVIAESMERIADLEKQLRNIRAETSHLEETDKVYRRYLNLVTQVEAAALVAANSDFDSQARLLREATAKLKSAQDRQDAIELEREEEQFQLAKLEGERVAAETVIRDHAGAELPHMEQRAGTLAQEAWKAAERAGAAEAEAVQAAEQADTSGGMASEGRNHASGLREQLREYAAALGADAAVEHLLAAGQRPFAADGTGTAAAGIDQLCALPLAWAEERAIRVRDLQETLNGHVQAQRDEKSAAAIRRRAEGTEDACREQAETETGKRADSEMALRRALSAWATRARQLGPVPQELTTPDEDAGDDRLDPDRLDEWLAESVNATRTRINLQRHDQDAAAQSALAAAAAQVAQAAHAEQESAAQDAVKADSDYNEALERTDAENSAADQRIAEAHRKRDQVVASASAERDVAEKRLASGVARARQEASAWIGSVNSWRTALVQLSIGDLALPMQDAGPQALDSVIPADIQVRVADAHVMTAARLQHDVAIAEQEVARAEKATADAEADLTEASRAAPVPTPPPWRTRQQDDGIPLWSLVDFSEHLPADHADRLEGALLVSGLLDALVTRDGRAVAGDLVITPAKAATGRTLADFLVIDPDSRISADRVNGLLRAIPVDAPGHLANGVLIAAAPHGYRSAFIGRTARERARLARVRALEQKRAAASAQLASARDSLRDCRENMLAAAAERDSIPPADALLAARQRASDLNADLTAARERAAGQTSRADLELQKALADLDRAAAARDAVLAAVEQVMRHASQIAAGARAKSLAADAAAAEQADKERSAVQARDEAAALQSDADAEHAAFPAHELRAVRETHRLEDEAGAAINRARTALVEAIEEHGKAGAAVRDSLKRLNDAATMPDGKLLPTERTPLGDYRERVTDFRHAVDMWRQAARRAAELLTDAARDAAVAARRHAAATQAAGEALNRRLEADQQATAVAEARRLYGAEYEDLRKNLQRVTDALGQADARIRTLTAEKEEVSGTAAAAHAMLDGIAPQRERAEQHRDECLRHLGRLVEERLASMPADIPADASGRPANLTAGLTWARLLLAQRPAGTDRVSALAQARGRALATLENSVRNASTALTQYNRQVTLFTVEGADWRRAVVADPDAARGEDLRLTVETLRSAAEQLDADLREDVKLTLKTGLFTRLQRDIQMRREAAQELVRQIRSTLGGVRTGVANVGVEVEWSVRKDADAERMVHLISQPPSDEVFGQMYDVLRQRMDETVGEDWAARVAHAFDYRAWHDWRIWVTHASFGDRNGQEQFREVTPRSNPLESLSTGERRLATMLPLLAAAWSMYSGHAYQGPRLLSIDEIDAAFDEPNLRQVLGLLRAWQFDVLATAPSMTPMIKREAGHAVIHQVIAKGHYRVTVPWLWEGHGEPRPLALDLASGTAWEQS